MAKARIGLTEKHIQETCSALLIADGWRAIRTDPVSDRGRGKGFGEVGMPDYLYLRYWNDGDPGTGRRVQETGKVYWPAAEVWFIEYKAPGKKPAPHQERWIAAERRRGALVWVVDDIDQFRKDYVASGLRRKVL